MQEIPLEERESLTKKNENGRTCYWKTIIETSDCLFLASGQTKCISPYSGESIPIQRDSDYYDLYENPSWKPVLWYHRLLNSIYRCLYFISGPKFIVLITGDCSINSLPAISICSSKM